MMLTAVGDFGARSDTTVLLLHGWGSDERDLAGLAPYLPPGVEWASVRAPLRHPSYGYAWYPLESDASWNDAVAVSRATEALWEWVDSKLGDDALVAPVGFSQGGLMASQLLRTRPERVSATAILSGYVLAEPQSADAEVAATQPPVFWGRGSDDTVIPLDAIAVTDEFLTSHCALRREVYVGLGHSVNDRELADLRTFLNAALTP